MPLVSRIFRAIPLHVNPDQPEDDETLPWLCDLSMLSSSTNPTSIFAIGIDDPLQDRFLFCTSICVSVKETLYLDNHGLADGLALHHQRPYAMLRRQQNSSIGSFLHNLSLAVSPEKRLRAFMMADEEDDEDMDSPSEDSVLTLMLHFDIDTIISPIALSVGIITGSEEIEHISMRFEFSRTARAAHVASLALMMAAHDRLGGGSMLGKMLGPDILHLICDAYRLRLYECRRHVWNE
jgi:hypothetical protein